MVSSKSLAVVGLCLLPPAAAFRTPSALHGVVIQSWRTAAIKRGPGAGLAASPRSGRGLLCTLDDGSSAEYQRKVERAEQLRSKAMRLRVESAQQEMQLANEQAARHQARVDELSRHGSTDVGSSASLDDAQQQAARYQARAQAAAEFLASTQHGSATDMATPATSTSTSTAAADMAAAATPAAFASAAPAAELGVHEDCSGANDSILQGDAADLPTPTLGEDEFVISETALRTFTDFANLGQNTTAAIAYFRKIGAASRANALEEAVADLHQMEAEVNQ
eukprot:TRINITY_DN5781_c0_g1_i1.p1 TRINITY_DN5781_c0_g1~~TRINITY_DN5781_c0_g1_i1.p1  ORF type:complete len:280 (-),score=73.79 TRINITY_DN5781_c0_g1_i1:1177-2016(-)